MAYTLFMHCTPVYILIVRDCRKRNYKIIPLIDMNPGVVFCYTTNAVKGNQLMENNAKNIN